MRIRMRTTIAGPGFTPVIAGKEVELPKKQAEDLIEKGYAEPVAPQAPAQKKAAQDKEAETASIEVASETEMARQPPAKRRGNR